VRRLWILAVLAAAALLLAACGPGGRYVTATSAEPVVVISTA
jgi:hypothetical protein